MELSVIKCKFLYVECFQTFNCIHGFFFIFEVYYIIVFFLVHLTAISGIGVLSILLALFTSDKEGYICFCPRSFVCLSVCL